MHGCRAYLAYRQAAARVNETLPAAVHIVVPNHSASKPQVHLRLPDIHLPTFSGDYSQWAQFKQMFLSLILNDTRLMYVKNQDANST